MLRDETRVRLRRLNRKLVARNSDSSAQPQRVADHNLRNSEPSSTPTPELTAGQEVATSAGNYWLIRRPLIDLWPEYATFAAKWMQNRGQLSQRELADDYREFCRWFPDRTVFLDLETCGFAGSTVFLAGLLHHDQGQLVLSQLWARNYAEEKPLLLSLRDVLLRDQQVLVTFNGKSFDWPHVRDRSVLHAGQPESGLPELVHLDLLHHARRRWKHQLPNCKLQTLEKFICGRLRRGDIPGSEIPAVYQHYVATGCPAQVNRVLHHNALDLVTLLQLALCIWENGEE